MQSASTLSEVPFRQVPRRGQRRVFEALREHGSYLNVQLPTGYGKTFTAVGCYSLKQHAGDVNRLLMVFPTDAQLRQFETDSQSDQSDFCLAAVEGPPEIVDVRFFGAEAIRKHRTNVAQGFAITIQALLQPRGDDIVRTLMQTGRWMVVVDEYHHYGLDKAWGRSVRSLPAGFLLAMSATPARATNDSAFGVPHITVSYRDAVKEHAVKPLRGHSYHYRIDAVTTDGTVRTFTTAELAQEAGGDSPDAVECWRIQRKMRWSPKYVSPLVSTPIERMQRARVSTGHRNLQVLIGAMCVSHAQLVCEQVRAMFEELRIDWVGTGPNGRDDADNKRILEQFCPPKNAQGHRDPTLDVLVHVGMAGEGLDSVYVTEIVHLNRANKNNGNDQENGRAARWLADADGHPIEGNINFDATSEYARFVGPAMMDAMDGEEPTEATVEDEDTDASDGSPRELTPLPEEPAIVIYHMELEHIDSGDPSVRRMAAALVTLVREFSEKDLDDPNSPIHERALREYREMRRREAEAADTKSVVLQWQTSVQSALSAVAGRVMRQIVQGGQRPERSLAGDIKRRINSRKKASLGEVSHAVAVYQAHYRWLRNLEQDIIDHGLPTWLS